MGASFHGLDGDVGVRRHHRAETSVDRLGRTTTLGILRSAPTSAARPASTYAMENLTSSEHNLRSQEQARSAAPPTYAPWIAAITGCGHLSSDVKDF